MGTDEENAGEKVIIIKQKIFIHAPAEKVWKVFTNLEKWPKMNPIYKYAKHIKGYPWAKGSMFEFQSDYGFLKTKAKPIILKSNPPYFIEWIGTKPLIKGKHSFTFRKVRNGTEVINYEEFNGIGLLIINILKLKPKIEKSFKYFMQGLKREAERKSWM